MGRGEKLAGYKFQPGVSGNPAGRPASGLALKELRKFTREHVADTFNKVMDMTDEELTELMADKETPVFEKACAKAVQKARESGDMGQIHTMLERIVGKVPQKFEGEFTGPGGAPLPPPVLQLMPVQSLVPAPPEAPSDAA